MSVTTDDCSRVQMIKSIVFIGIIVRREGTPGNWAEAPENKGKRGTGRYALRYNSPISYDNHTTPYESAQLSYTL